jgi:hypothetical protein
VRQATLHKVEAVESRAGRKPDPEAARIRAMSDAELSAFHVELLLALDADERADVEAQDAMRRPFADILAAEVAEAEALARRSRGEDAPAPGPLQSRPSEGGPRDNGSPGAGRTFIPLPVEVPHDGR